MLLVAFSTSFSTSHLEMGEEDKSALCLHAHEHSRLASIIKLTNLRQEQPTVLVRWPLLFYLELSNPNQATWLVRGTGKREVLTLGNRISGSLGKVELDIFQCEYKLSHHFLLQGS